MNCLVLAAGMSTRLAAISGGIPKPLMPIDGVPILHRNLRWLERQGIKDVYINLHYGADEIKASVGDGKKCGVRAQWSYEDPILGTSGAAKKLEKELCRSIVRRFLVVYGDNVYNFNVDDMIQEHRFALKRDPFLVGTVAVFDPNINPHTGIAGGRVVTDANWNILDFKEGGASQSGLVNAACYVLEPDVFNAIAPPPQASDWGRDTLPILLRSGAHLKAFPIKGYCLGIDTPEAYARAQALFLSKTVR